MSDREPRRATRPAVPMGQFDTSMQTALGTRDGVQNYQERFDAWLDSQPVTFRCSLCAWTVETSAGEGRELAAKHRADKHPGAVSKRRRRPSKQKERERAERAAEQRRKSAAFLGDT